MEHQYAVEHHLVEQYLLNEMSADLRDRFEEHFFDCQQCVADLRATAAFLDTARAEFDRPEFITIEPKQKVFSIKQGRLLQWKPAFAFVALAASLLVIVYQNAIVYPHLRTEVARLEAPEILPSVSLVSGNSRGDTTPSVAVGTAKSLLLLVDIPAQDRFSNYICELYSPHHELLWTGQVPAQQTKDTISIRVPIANKVSGSYSLVVKGIQNSDAANSGVDLATYSFLLNGGTLGSGQ
jgi:hypothetical protein